MHEGQRRGGSTGGCLQSATAITVRIPRSRRALLTCRAEYRPHTYLCVLYVAACTHSSCSATRSRQPSLWCTGCSPFRSYSSDLTLLCLHSPLRVCNLLPWLHRQRANPSTLSSHPHLALKTTNHQSPPLPQKANRINPVPLPNNILPS